MVAVAVVGPVAVVGLVAVRGRGHRQALGACPKLPRSPAMPRFTMPVFWVHSFMKRSSSPTFSDERLNIGS